MADLIAVVFIFFIFIWLFVTNKKDSLSYNKNIQKYGLKALSAVEVRNRIVSFPFVSVKHVVDGDTVIIKKGWSNIKLRLDSIDCPEDGQYWGDNARYGLIKLIGGKRVHIEEHGLDSYGRTLATIYVWNDQKREWMNVNERMVMLGHAWVMRRFYGHLPKDRQCKLNNIERWAKSKKVGLWHEGSGSIPPWEWRKKPWGS